MIKQIRGRRFAVRHLKVYDALVELGHRPQIIATDKLNPNRMVWLFPVSDQLLRDLGKISKQLYGSDTEYRRASDASAPT